MSSFRMFLPICITSLASLLGTTAASFALTGEEVWEKWQAAALAGDHPLTAESVSRTAGKLDLRGLKTSLTLGSREILIGIDQVILQETPEGSVSVLLSEKPQIGLSVGDRSIALDLTHQGFAAKVSGLPDALTHEMTAERLALGFDARKGNGAGDIPFDILLDLGSVAASYVQVTSQDGEAKIGANSIDATLRAGDTLPGRSVEAILHFEGASATASLHDFADVDASNIAARIAAGSAISAKANVAKSGYEMKIVRAPGAEGMDALRGVAGASAMELSLDAAGLRSSVTTEGVQAATSGFGLPPVAGSLGTLSAAIDWPALQAQEGSSAAMRVGIDALALDAATWTLIDPKNALDHAPLSFAMDVAGLVKPLGNLLDFTLWQGEKLPLQVVGADLRAFEAKAIGVNASASGSVKFDASDLETYEGYPKPEGQIDLTLSGIEPALGDLAEAGILDAQKISAARFFLALFMTPAETVNVFTTKIEATADGAVLANGQRIR